MTRPLRDDPALLELLEQHGVIGDDRRRLVLDRIDDRLAWPPTPAANADVAELLKYNRDAFLRSSCTCGHAGKRHVMMVGDPAKKCWDYLWCNCVGFVARAPEDRR